MTLIDKKLKVMHFVSGFKNGGVEQVVLNYTSLLNKNYNIEESVIYQHMADPEKLRLSRQIGNRMYQIPFKKTHPIKNLYATYNLIKKQKPDIVHAHMNLVNFFPLMVAKFLGVPVRISHSHIARDNVNSKLVPFLKKLNMFFATDLMACGEAAGKYMYGNKNFTILYNAIDQSRYQFNKEYRKEIRQRYNIDKNTIILGSIGRNVKQKNQKFLIDIFANYLKINSNSLLMLIGNGLLSDDLDEYIRQKSCTDKVIRIKQVLSTEKYYSAFDVFLLPSLYEGLPVVAIEAQESGVTTLLSKNIDPTVMFTNNVKLLPVNMGVKCWLQDIRKSDRKRSDIISDKYDINIQYKHLYSYYVNTLRKKLGNV